jgi:hypothetical protein
MVPFRVPSLDSRPQRPFGPGRYLPGFRPSSRHHRQRSRLIPAPKYVPQSDSRTEVRVSVRFPHRSTFLGPSPAPKRDTRFRESFQALATFRPQAFAASRRLTPLSGSAGLFHPAATSRVRPVQGRLSPRSAQTLVELRCPLVVDASRAHRLATAATRSTLDFEALIHARPRSPGKGG